MILKSKKSELFDEKELELTGRHIRLVDEKKKDGNNFFYRVENPGQLAQVGRSYLDDYKTGIKNFAFSSINYKSSQQRTVLGIASYFDHLFEMRILIISDMLHKGVFEEIIQECSVEHVGNHDERFKIKVNRFYHHFDLVDVNKVISDFANENARGKFSKIFASFLDSYDLILWDTPVIESNRDNANIFLHSAPFIESITFIVSPTVSRTRDLKILEKYFINYGINIKGIIFESFEGKTSNNETYK